MEIQDFEVVPHTADIQLRVYGNSKEELFCNALKGMFENVDPQTKSCSIVKGRIVCNDLNKYHKVQVESPDLDALLVDFLSEALYLSDVNNEAYFDAKIIKLSDNNIEATIYGVDVVGFGVEIKAVTYHNLAIKQVEGLWQTDIVFDI